MEDGRTERAFVLDLIERAVQENSDLRNELEAVRCQLQEAHSERDEILGMAAQGLRPVQCEECDALYWVLNVPDMTLCSACELEYIEY